MLPRTFEALLKDTPTRRNAHSCLAGLCSPAFFGSFPWTLTPQGWGKLLQLLGNAGSAAAPQGCQQLSTGMSVLLLMLSLRISLLSGSGWWEEMLSFVSG